MSKLDFITKESGNNKKLKSKLRMTYAKTLISLAQQGILDSYRAEPAKRKPGKPSDDLYGVNPAEYGKPEVVDDKVTPSLSTRYVPGKPGVSAERVRGTNGGVYKDPNTNKIYDWNQGFTDEHGHKYEGSSVKNQTDIFSNASICDPSKLKKFSNFDSLPISDNVNQGEVKTASLPPIAS